MKIRFAVFLSLLFISIQCLATAAVQCANADLSKLAKLVYVSPQGSDGGGCGQSTTSPCKTIKKAIENCSGGSCGVLVRYGIYDTGEPVNIADGVSLYGSCVFDETPYRYRSTIIGNPAIQARGINKPTVLEGFVILGSTALKAGEASVAFMVSNSTGLVLRENVMASGKGGNGANGSTLSAGAGQMGDFVRYPIGGEGGFACTANRPPGSTGRGGKGADIQRVSSSCNGFLGTCSCSNSNFPDSVGGNGANSGSVLGGAGGQRGSSGCACTNRAGGDAGNGPNGGDGKMGASGTEGGAANPHTRGSFAGTTWQPAVGRTGAAGQVGSGGGGGGSGGYAALTGAGNNFDGFPGGGGGGGGCGGPGGTGGQQGGASIPLVSFASSVAGLAAYNALIPGPGGKGAAGGTGARGGNGGNGAPGYGPGKTKVSAGIGGIVCSGYVPGFGGRGGNGGQGGAGAGGAGGNGGPSFGIALVNSSSLSASDIVIYPAQPGSGGDPGPGGQNDATNIGANGKAGLPGFSDDRNSIVSFTSSNLLIGAHQ